MIAISSSALNTPVVVAMMVGTKPIRSLSDEVIPIPGGLSFGVPVRSLRMGFWSIEKLSIHSSDGFIQ
jgi:hypothetical protein